MRSVEFPIIVKHALRYDIVALSDGLERARCKLIPMMLKTMRTRDLPTTSAEFEPDVVGFLAFSSKHRIIVPGQCSSISGLGNQPDSMRF